MQRCGPINISAGDGSLESTGVTQRSSMARCRLCFSFLHFLMIFLMVCTCLSMNPVTVGTWGMRWCVGCPPCGESPGMVSQWVPIGFPMYCGPLSLTISSGQPNSETAFLISCMTFSLVLVCRGVTMGYFEKYLHTSRKYSPSTSNKSVPSFFQGATGVSCGMRGSFLLQFANS